MVLGRQKIGSLFLVLSIAFLGCGKSADEEDESPSTDEEAPTVPPSSTIDLDLGVQGDSEQTVAEDTLMLGSFAATANMGGTNHTFAALSALAVHLGVRYALAVPSLMIKRSAQESPTYQGDLNWLWSYELTSGGVTYTSNYTGHKVSSTSSEWEMRVTTDQKRSDGCCEDFLFFTGDVTNATQGSWTVYDPEDHENNTNQLYSIIYDVTDIDNRTLLFTAQKEKTNSDAFGKGSTVNFEVTSSTITVTHQDIVDSSPTIITWDRSTVAGKLTRNNGDTFCWGPKEDDFPNETCPGDET
jgi:hypothetical protein